MSDTLYLSLWYPNLRLEALPDKLTAVLGAFAAHGGEARVYCRHGLAGELERDAGLPAGLWAGGEASERGAEPRQAVEEALELLHDDYAYEFQIGWSLWELETRRCRSFDSPAEAAGSLRMTIQCAQDDMIGRWVREPRLVRVTGFGPLFDEGAYEQDGHIRVDFGTRHAVS